MTTLLPEWQKVSIIIGLNMNLSGKRIRTRSVESARKFLKMGGFLEGITVCAKGMKRHQGIEKNKRLKDILDQYEGK